MKQQFAVTKTKTIELTNDQIKELRGMSRTKAAVYLDINESQARKVIEAIRDGILVEVVVVKSATKKAAGVYVGRDVNTLDDTKSVGVFFRKNIDNIFENNMTLDQAFEKVTKMYMEEIEKRIPSNVTFNDFVRAKLRDAFGRCHIKKVGKGRNAVWVK